MNKYFMTPEELDSKKEKKDNTSKFFYQATDLNETTSLNIPKK